MKKFLSTSLLIISACMLMAQQTYSYGDFVTEIWQVNGRQSAVIVGYNGASAHVNIPDQINGYPVTGITDNAFRSRNIASVAFPSTLLFIGDYAFYDNNLTSVSLPASVTSIGTGAFDNNHISGNVPETSGNARYVRTITIEPAHGETVITQKPAISPNQPPRNVNIVVIPGYNPIRPSQHPSTVATTTNIVTVQETKPANAAIPVLPGTRTTTPPPYLNSANTPVTSSPLPLIQQSNEPAQPQQGYAQTTQPQQGYVQLQQVQDPVVGSPPSYTRDSKIRLVPENVVDPTSALTADAEETIPLRIQPRGVYPIDQEFRAR
jgi:hypothetical protein